MAKRLGLLNEEPKSAEIIVLVMLADIGVTSNLGTNKAILRRIEYGKNV